MNAPVLMISYEAPPRLSAEAILAAKTMKALADANPPGPVVDLICAAPGDEVPADTALAELLPATLRVHRLDPASRGRKSILQRLLGGKEGWRKAAVSKGAALFPAEHKKPAVLYSRSHPPASHLAALELITGPFKGVPWVAHFSDPWSRHCYYKSRVTRAALGHYEQQVLAAATRLVFVSDALRDLMLAGRRRPLKPRRASFRTSLILRFTLWVHQTLAAQMLPVAQKPSRTWVIFTGRVHPSRFLRRWRGCHRRRHWASA